VIVNDAIDFNARLDSYRESISKTSVKFYLILG